MEVPELCWTRLPPREQPPSPNPADARPVISDSPRESKTLLQMNWGCSEMIFTSSLTIASLDPREHRE